MRNEKSVLKAARLLDAERPNWFMHVSPGSIHMGSTERCVLGQIYGDFRRAPRALLSPTVFFTAFNAISPRKERRLVALWAQEISERRARLLVDTGGAQRARVAREMARL